MAPAWNSTYTYIPGSSRPFNLSRSKIDLFLNCPHCFYLETRLGIKRPQSFPYTLNNAVDKLLKKEFNHYRDQKIVPPILAENKIQLKPAPFPQFIPTEGWQAGKISTLHAPTNFLVNGLIDDLWINSENRYHIVDYKATANIKPITSLDREYHKWYKKQVEVYQWILERNQIKVDPIAYFLYATANLERLKFAGRLDFQIHVIAHHGDHTWIEPTLMKIKNLLDQSEIPAFSENCHHCNYSKKLQEIPKS